jgi:hypothetical protein
MRIQDQIIALSVKITYQKKALRAERKRARSRAERQEIKRRQQANCKNKGT